MEVLMNLNMSLIGQRIKSRRKDLKLTQNDIKELTGISSGNMSEIENGNRLPAANTLVQLANTLQCSIDWLLTGKSPKSEKAVISDLGEMETVLIASFRLLNKDDKEETLEIVQMKLRKNLRGGAGSFNILNEPDPNFQVIFSNKVPGTDEDNNGSNGIISA